MQPTPFVGNCAVSISINKVTLFKPNGAKYIADDESTDEGHNETTHWSINATSNAYGEEEIYSKGNRVIWSYPVCDVHCPPFMEFITDSVPKQLLWTTFEQCSLSCEHGGKEFPVVVEHNSISVIGMDNGLTKVTLPLVLLNDKRINISSIVNLFVYLPRFYRNDHYLPNLFTLSHPLDEVKPIISRLNGEWFYGSDKRSYITSGLAADEQLLLRYDEVNQIHSLWLFRKCTAEDRHQATNMTLPFLDQSCLTTATASAFNPQNTSFLREYHHPASPSILNVSHFSRRGSLLMNTGGSNLVSGATANMAAAAGPTLYSNPKRLASMAAICRSPLTETLRAISRPQSQLYSTAVTPTPCSINDFSTLTIGGGYCPSSVIDRVGRNGSFLATLTADCEKHQLSMPDPLSPDYCIECIWSDSSLKSSIKNIVCATKFFSLRDLSNNRWVAYLMPNINQLRLILLEKYSGNTTTIRAVHTINAHDALFVPSIKFLIVLDQIGNILLYSGTSRIAKVLLHEETIMPNHYHLNIATMTPFQHVRTSSRPNSFLRTPLKFPQSPVNSSSTHATPYSTKPYFDDSLNELNPNNITETPSSSIAVQSLNYRSLSDVRGKLFNICFPDNKYYSVELPNICRTPLCVLSLKAVCSCVPSEVFNQFIATFYSKNINPLYEHSPNEWYTFVSTLLFLIGYDTRKCTYIKRLQGKMSSPTPPPIVKKTKIDTHDNDEDWLFAISEAKRIDPKLLKLLKKEDSQLLNKTIESEDHDDLFFMTINNQDDDICDDDDNLLIDDEEQENDENDNDLTTKEWLAMEQDYSNENTDRNTSISSNIFLNRSKNITAAIASTPGGDKQRSAHQEQKLFRYSNINVNAPLYTHAGYIFCALHIVYEDLSLNHTKEIISLLELLYLLACDFDLTEYRHYYLAENWKISKRVRKSHQLAMNSCSMYMPKLFCASPPSYLKWLRLLIKDDSTCILQPFPYIHDVTNRISLCTKNLPLCIHALLYEAISYVATHPKFNLSRKEYEFIGRNDLIYHDPKLFDKNFDTGVIALRSLELIRVYGKDFHNDKTRLVESEVLKLRFPEDLRVQTIVECLQSSTPILIDIPQRLNVTEQEIMEGNERYLYSVAQRTMSLPFGRGALTLGTVYASPHDAFVIPELNLKGRVPSSTITVNMSHIDVPQNITHWPLFHNGVASATAINRHACDMGSNWIRSQILKSSDITNEQAGFLYGLGLIGHFKDLPKSLIYSLLQKANELTMMASLLGICVSNYKSMSLSLTSLLTIYIKSMLPQTLFEWEVPFGVQICGIMGLGLLYANSGDRYISDILLAEIGKLPVSTGEKEMVILEREAYAFTSGLALGTVLFKKGVNNINAKEDFFTSALLSYIIGKERVYSFGILRTHIQVAEYGSMNANITATGAMISIGLIYFNTKNKDIAEWFMPNDTMRLIELIRPDLLLLRAVVYNLITWDKIESTNVWFDQQIPEALRQNAFRNSSITKMKTSINAYDPESITQAYCYLVSGLCFSLALKYAGTWDKQTTKLIREYYKQFYQYIDHSSDQVENDCYPPDRSTLEFVLSTLVLSLAMVMTGSGDLQLLQLLRSLQARVGSDCAHVTYGSHLSVSMAMGLLLLGGGRYGLRNDDDAIPVLIAAFYPHFPVHSNDNRFHLQIFRHLYVMVCESRLMITKDASNHQICSVNGRLWLDTKSSTHGTIIENFRTPYFLPNFVSIKKLEITDPSYCHISYKNDDDINRLKQILSRDGLFYVQKINSSQTTTSSFVQLLSGEQETLRNCSHGLQLYMEINCLLNDPINSRHVKEMNSLIAFYDKYTKQKHQLKKLKMEQEQEMDSTNDDILDDSLVLKNRFTNVLLKTIASMLD
ncbi:unnamed protein product [Didymodactylos carnosus]|uniref:Anaphase-promoting complex subunit 1 middle domain-containing protein n=1 Tax=Didymodactylos carnosus TaxID=1234261 RepID=A0A8S2HRF5_9BILA|nr:unnamed protein product [Didymodactylos carnosus]CAF3659402.1 unnamed protein product [Didymodactylos carnosus]